MYYIANFKFFTDQEQSEEKDRRHGDFSMLVSAESDRQAISMFQQRLIAFRESSSFFTGRCRIFISQLLNFEQIPQQEAVLLNLQSYVGDPVLPFIACIVPTEHTDACSIHDWQQDHPTTEGHKDSLFLSFD